jgi:four helix bundle protein
MTEIQNSKHYDLEERTFVFAKRVNEYINKLPRTITSVENSKQLARSAGSVGANYIEANESLSKKDFFMRIKISRKEAKESMFWLRLTEPLKDQLKEKEHLIQEANELMKIFGAILTKTNCKI